MKQFFTFCFLISIVFLIGCTNNKETSSLTFSGNIDDSQIVETQERKDILYNPEDMIHLVVSSGSYMSSEISSVQYFGNAEDNASIMRIGYDLTLNDGQSYNAMIYYRGTGNFTQQAFEEYTKKYNLQELVNVNSTDDKINSKYLGYGDAYTIAKGKKQRSGFTIQTITIFSEIGYYFNELWGNGISNDLFYLTSSIPENNYFSELAIQILDTHSYSDVEKEGIVLQYINGLSLAP